MKPLLNAERFLILAFLAVLWAVPLSQAVVELCRGEWPQALALFDQKPTAANLRAYERELEDASQAARWLRPWAQYAQFAWFKDGGEKALLGRAGWLFYKPGVQCLTQRPDARRGQSNATEALAAIVSLRDQLAARGIQLLVVPAPNKESVYPEKVTRRAERQNGVVGGETRRVLSGLKAAGVEVVDLFELFARAKQERTPTALYLAQDSHWSPLGARLAAGAVARRIKEKGWMGAGDLEYEEKSAPVARRGDILRMLQVPALERRVPPEAIPCLQVVRRDNHQPYRDAAGSEVLVLGDSFLRIYEKDEPRSAGFIAHLAKELKRPLASIVNDGGASTLVRQELCRRPALLAKVKLVVWEFVERDIRLGTEGWQVLQLPAMPGQEPVPPR
ncbi:MAG: hypothetical protein ABSF95_14470 [Verrucomicrobiota bacterium]|jgi:hypothetical protein